MDNKQDKTILVVGGDGKIGGALAAYLVRQNYKVIKTSRRKLDAQNYWYLDLSEVVPVYDLPKNISVAFICAGITSIEECRLHPDETYIVNVQQTEILCKQIIATGGRIIFLSSNVVFDGSRPYRRVEEPLSPVTEYGRQKAEAEKRLLALGKDVVVIRLTKVVTRQMPLFAEWVNLLKNGIAIHPRQDMILSPLSLDFVVKVLSLCIDTTYSGILQLSGAIEISYTMLAQEIARQLGISLDLIQPLEMAESSGNKGMQHATLDTTILKRLFNVEAPSYEHVICSMLEEAAN